MQHRPMIPTTMVAAATAADPSTGRRPFRKQMSIGEAEGLVLIKEFLVRRTFLCAEICKAYSGDGFYFVRERMSDEHCL